MSQTPSRFGKSFAARILGRFLIWIRVRFRAVPRGDFTAWILRQVILNAIWDIHVELPTLEKLTSEFQSYLTLAGNANSTRVAADVAGQPLQTTVDEQTAIVNQAQTAADQAVAAKQAEKDLADAEAADAFAKAEAQKFYIGGLLGLTPPTEDPTVDVQ